jgi:hypothetical protein
MKPKSIRENVLSLYLSASKHQSDDLCFPTVSYLDSFSQQLMRGVPHTSVKKEAWVRHLAA